MVYKYYLGGNIERFVGFNGNIIFGFIRKINSENYGRENIFRYFIEDYY